MEQIEQFLESLGLEEQITLEDIPDIDLYMDQVIQLFENKFSKTKRHEDDKILTKTMINNYAKARLFFPVKNKKYTKHHLILISLIFQMKGALSIRDIKSVLEKLNEKVVTENFPLEDLYSAYLRLVRQNSKQVRKSISDIAERVKEESEIIADPDADYLEKMLSVATFCYLSNMFRRAAEQLADEIHNEG